MNNGGQSYRWQQLMQYLEVICDDLLWLSPLLTALDAVIAPISDSTPLDSALWPLAVVVIWSVGLVIYQLLFKLPAKPNLPKARTLYLVFSIVMLGIYIGLAQDISSLTMAVLAIIAFNSLLYANFGLVFANMIGLEMLVIFSGKIAGLTSTGYGTKSLMVLSGVVYGAVLLILSLYNSDKSLTAPSKTTKYAVTDADDGIKTLIDNLDCGVMRVDQDLKISLCNDVASTMFELNNQIMGRELSKILTLTDLDDQSVRLDELIRATHTVRTTDQLIYIDASGEKIRLELTIAPIKNAYGVAETGECLLMWRDVTFERNLMTERDEFARVIGQELHRPIAQAEMGLQDVEALLTQKTDPLALVHALNKSHQYITQLATATNNLASLARAEQAEIVQFQLVDVAKVLQGLFEKNQPAVNSKGLQFDLDLDPKLPKIATNSAYLEEILQNLLTNSLKYTETGGINLSASVKARQVEIAVIDTGLGIAKNQQTQIFDKFYQVKDYRTANRSGFGLGLYVAKQLAHKLGGQLKVKSRIGFGSTFSLILPKITRLKK